MGDLPDNTRLASDVTTARSLPTFTSHQGKHAKYSLLHVHLVEFLALGFFFAGYSEDGGISANLQSSFLLVSSAP
jgi:hypothetical protein